MKLSLIVMAAGKMEGKAIEIKVPQFVIGRDPQCQLRPASPMISKRHCALIQKDGKVYLKDFGSTNGSFVNDVQVKNAAQIKNGDKLKIGPLLFEVRLEGAGAVQKSTPAPQTARAEAVEPAGVEAGKAEGARVPAGKVPAAAAAAKGAKSDKIALKPPPPASRDEPNVDDDIAALLLAGGGSEDETVNDTPAALAAGIPQGTTVFDLPVSGQQAEGDQAKANKEKEKEKEKPKHANTSSAAADILEQLRKRPRATS